jgi:anti-anti-sigma factor
VTAVIAADPFGEDTVDLSGLPRRPPWQLAVLDGELDLATAPLVAATLLASAGMTESGAGVVVDLTHVAFCDSEGLAALIAVHDHLRSTGRGLVLRNPSSTVVVMIDLLFALPDLVEPADGRRECRPAC